MMNWLSKTKPAGGTPDSVEVRKTTMMTIPNSPDDDALVRRSRSDPAATQAIFEELYRRHFQRVYRYHLAHTGNEADAQDLTAQTFLAALEGFGGYRGAGSFAAWLLGIARRKMAQLYRSRRPEEALEAAENLADPTESTEALAGQRLQFAQVNRAMRNISPERAEAIELCIFGSLTAAEAAQVMGKSEAAVKMLLLRGLKDLRERVAFSEDVHLDGRAGRVEVEK